jgi:hypothetical protein
MLQLYATSVAHLALLFAFPEAQLEILIVCLRLGFISIDLFDKHHRRLFNEPMIHFFTGEHALAAVVLGLCALIGATKIFYFELTMFFVDVVILVGCLGK